MKFFLPPLLGAALAVSAHAADYSTLPPQPEDAAWPTTAWTRDALPASADAEAVEQALEAYMADANKGRLGVTYAVVIVHKGKIVAERYADGYSCNGIAHTMSIAKMMGGVLAGAMTQDELIDVHSPAEIPLWREKAEDPRATVTPAQILQMTSGLKWHEMFDFLELAFGRGVQDNADFVIKKPLEYEPGTHFQYSDGAPGIIGYLLARELNGGADAVETYMRENLLNPIGMTNTEPEFDPQGTWYGSSGMRWSPCDLARFSLLLLRDGVWDGERLLPEGWVNFMRTPTTPSMSDASTVRTGYGAGYGLTTFVYDLDFQSPQPAVDAFGHTGFGGHILKIIPSKDLVIAVLGSGAIDPALFKARLEQVDALADAFPPLPDTPAPAATTASD